MLKQMTQTISTKAQVKKDQLRFRRDVCSLLGSHTEEHLKWKKSAANLSIFCDTAHWDPNLCLKEMEALEAHPDPFDERERLGIYLVALRESGMDVRHAEKVMLWKYKCPLRWNAWAECSRCGTIPVGEEHYQAKFLWCPFCEFPEAELKVAIGSALDYLWF